MEIDEHDPLTGHKTTGHEWNGIKELNTPVPIVVWIFLALAFLFSVGYWVLMPTWPTGSTYTRGILGIHQHTAVDKDIRQARMSRAVWTRKIEQQDFKTIEADSALMAIVQESGRTLFEDNCAACHGLNAGGGPGFPSFRDKAWLWGGTPEAIAETIRVGVNSAHKDTRASQMLAFGHDKILDRNAILDVVAYVRSLSHPAARTDAEMKAINNGKAVFAANCVSCHGENAKGNTEMGAPDLTDNFWLYGGDLNSVYTTVWGGRQGHMPTWEARLSPVERKILTLYVFNLSKPEAGKTSPEK